MGFPALSDLGVSKSPRHATCRESCMVTKNSPGQSIVQLE
jgi:hypothetical protein